MANCGVSFSLIICINLYFNYCRQIRRTSVSEELLTENDILCQLKTFLYALSSALSAHEFNGDPRSTVAMADKVMTKVFGFTLERQTSRLPGLSGRGVFVNNGRVPPKHIVALYPGTLYLLCDNVCILKSEKVLVNKNILC